MQNATLSFVPDTTEYIQGGALKICTPENQKNKKQRRPYECKYVMWLLYKVGAG